MARCNSAFRSQEIILLRVDSRQKAMRSGICGINLHRGIQFLECGGLIAKIVLSGAQSVVSVGPFWF